MPRPGAKGSQLSDLVRHLLEHGPRKTHTTSRRIRVIYNHTYIVDTTKAVQVWEHDGFPQYYLPTSELKNSDIRDKETIEKDGDTVATVAELTVPAKDGIPKATTGRVILFRNDDRLGALKGLARLEFDAMDQWLEEDVPIYVHPKDPFKRIDILPSTRNIEVKVAGKTVAKSASSVHLLETGLPTRYYLPLASVDQSVLRKSNLLTKCPYKGDAEYYNVVVGGREMENLVWYYRTPTHESAPIAGLVCFYNEKVEILLDGELV
ncbi:hypothetical protein AK830_g8239 [Neonectria ditissima]|uniref:DUF427 domain-containing protein n=1 Tax=Neonectria ditissima TaxID=78410 RepID=A0A0P7AY09_9HYPO|nr:hypothetical protein AK830_g8239 [Neonectria ditissima]